MSIKKFAVVTGANRGIGRVTAISLAAQGWTVALLGRDVAGVTAVAKGIGDAGIAVQCDVGSRDSVAQAFATIKAEFG